MGICGNVFENLTFGLTQKKTTITHVCPKCGYVDESPCEITKNGINFGKPAGATTGLSGLCPWSVKK